VATNRPSTWSNGPGDRYGAHDHAYDKSIDVVRGSIDFGLPASSDVVSLRAGDRLELPAGTTHDARVGPDGVTCEETHLPSGTFSAVNVRHAERNRPGPPRRTA
jgi:quercetin dioxygenase-like cupin family protein